MLVGADAVCLIMQAQIMVASPFCQIESMTL